MTSTHTPFKLLALAILTTLVLNSVDVSPQHTHRGEASNEKL